MSLADIHHSPGKSSTAERLQGLNVLLQSAIQNADSSPSRAYVLSLLGAAVRGGAEKLEAEVGTLGLTLTFDGELLTQRAMEVLLAGRKAPQDSRFHDLWKAFENARNLGPCQLEFLVWDGSHGFRVDLLSSTMNVMDKPDWANSEALMRFVFKENYDSQLIEEKCQATLQESSLLKTARLAPLNIQLNGIPLDNSLVLGQDSESCFAWTHVYPENPEIRALKPTYSQVFCKDDDQGAVNFEAVLCLDLPSEVRTKRLWLLCDGVLYERPAELLNLPFGYGLISAPFTKSEDHSDIVEDDLFRGVVTYARIKLENLLLERLDQFLSFAPDTVKMIKDFAPVLISRFRERQEEQKAERLERWAALSLGAG